MTNDANSETESAHDQPIVAEIISVGDEMTSGQRLDTNSQWLASNLNDLGVPVAYHSTVGDDLARHTEVVRIAMARADIVVMTGGLGPTKDDLSRQAIADATGLELKFEPSVLAHIEKLFARFQRKMTDANRVQAYFPDGSLIIDNPEGTAPGIDLTTANASQDSSRPSRIFALPGVPAEMKQMWSTHVGPAITRLAGLDQQIFHHTLRCFGIGESEAESRMPDMMSRDREPRVGITASSATISFRISTAAKSEDDFHNLITPTVSEIKDTLGEVVFGINDETLQDIVVGQLLSNELTIAMVDFEFGGAAARLLKSSELAKKASPVTGHYSLDHVTPAEMSQVENDEQLALTTVARQVAATFGSNIGIAIGCLSADSEDRSSGNYWTAIAWNTSTNDMDEHSGLPAGTSAGYATATREFRYGGHSSFRELRSAKQIINFLRIVLKNQS